MSKVRIYAHQVNGLRRSALKCVFILPYCLYIIFIHTAHPQARSSASGGTNKFSGCVYAVRWNELLGEIDVDLTIF
jgi:hypothetical protein